MIDDLNFARHKSICLGQSSNTVVIMQSRSVLVNTIRGSLHGRNCSEENGQRVRRGVCLEESTGLDHLRPHVHFYREIPHKCESTLLWGF